MAKLQGFRIRDEKVLSDFKELVLKEHGSLYMNLGEELTESMKEHMCLKGFKDYPSKVSILTGDHGAQAEHQPRTQKFNKRQIKLLKSFDKEFLNDYEIPHHTLVDFIKISLNVTDMRSVKKWINFLEVHGIITKKNVGPWINNTTPYTIDVLLGAIDPESCPEEGL